MPAVTIGSLEFPSKKAAKEFFRNIRDAYADSEPIDGKHEEYLLALIACHSEAETKIGVGIAGFTVGRDEVFGTTRHFMITRTDGTRTDFSFHSCIDGRNVRRDKLEALRRAVEDQIISFRARVFSEGSVRCPFLNTELILSKSHVDHISPMTFMALVNGWMESMGLNYDSIAITPPDDNQIVTRMTDVDQITSWQDYHQRHARLRVISPLGNLSHAKTTNRV